ncbi:MAG: ScpA family protein [Pseudomonadota bacterium]|nr:ScpA family protein [Pseudomonadota bacterium]
MTQPIPMSATIQTDTFLVDLDGYDGPLDLLLALARDKRIDLTALSIGALAEQYLNFIERMRGVRLEVAAEYLVMAAWLAYLKSRLLLPVTGTGPEPSAAEMAEALAFHLRRLEAMREMACTLMARPRVGIGVFARGASDVPSRRIRRVSDAGLADLLAAYGDCITRGGDHSYHLPEFDLLSIEEATERIVELLGGIKGWTDLSTFLPPPAADPLTRRSQIAATFGATLELARRGRLRCRQDKLFEPIWIKAERPGEKE